MRYIHLTKEMRDTVIRALNDGTTTPEEIRHNIRVQEFVDHQDEMLPYIMANDCIEKINHETGSSIGKIPFPVTVTSATAFMAEFKDGYFGLYEHTLGGELEYFLDKYEHDRKQ